MVRISGKDIDGNKTVKNGLALVRGVGDSFSNAIVRVLNLDPMGKMGELSDEQVAKIEALLKDPAKHNIPEWMLNRRREIFTGKTMHVVSSELEFSQKKDIQFLTDIKCRRGMRHAYGLKVRGQETRSRGRKGTTMGVTKKKALAKGASQPTGKEEKK